MILRRLKFHRRGEELNVEIRGLWYRTVLWEVPLMAIISELYFKMMGLEARDEEKSRL